jgi:hypothetical protein
VPAAFLAVVAAGFAPASAQSAYFKNQVAIDAGDLKIDHASGAAINVKDGKFEAGARSPTSCASATTRWSPLPRQASACRSAPSAR